MQKSVFCSIDKVRFVYCYRAGQLEEPTREITAAVAPAAPQVTVIPGVDSLIGDLLDMDMGPPMSQQYPSAMIQPMGAVPSGAAVDLLGEGLDSLVCTITVLIVSFKKIYLRAMNYGNETNECPVFETFFFL
jgi:hypothetical protein